MLDGWIKLHRSIEDHWIFKDADRLKAWLVILLSVNHSHQKAMIRGEIYECDIGQSLYSYDTWASKFGKEWSKQKVRTFFSLLEKDEMLTHEGLHYTTRITVCNYKTYQEKSINKSIGITHGQHTDNTPITHGQHADNTPITPNKNDKNENNGKNEKKKYNKPEFIAPSLADVVEFCKSKGYKYFDCNKYFTIRDGCGWVKTNGSKVLNWKNDVITSNTFEGWQRKKTDEEIEREAMDEFALKCAKDVKAG